MVQMDVMMYIYWLELVTSFVKVHDQVGTKHGNQSKMMHTLPYRSAQLSTSVIIFAIILVKISCS